MNREIVQLLDEFRQKGGAWQSQVKADKLKQDLKKLLTEEEWWQLNIAHSHYNLGEGAKELYYVVNTLISKYRQDPNNSRAKTLL